MNRGLCDSKTFAKMLIFNTMMSWVQKEPISLNNPSVPGTRIFSNPHLPHPCEHAPSHWPQKGCSFQHLYLGKVPTPTPDALPLNPPWHPLLCATSCHAGADSTPSSPLKGARTRPGERLADPKPRGGPRGNLAKFLRPSGDPPGTSLCTEYPLVRPKSKYPVSALCWSSRSSQGCQERPRPPGRQGERAGGPLRH